MNEKLYKIEPFLMGYLNSKYDDIGYRIANGMYERARHSVLSFRDGQTFAGVYDTLEPMGLTFHYGSGIICNEEKIAKNIENNPDCADELKRLAEEMRVIGTQNRVLRAQSTVQAELQAHRVGWGGGQRAWCCGHYNPNYLLKEGTKGVREKVEKYRLINPGKDVFYDGLILALDTLDLYAKRYRELALEKAEAAQGEDKERLLRIARALEWVPMNGPRDFFEACQSFWLVFSHDGADSPGRFDQTMIEYYRISDEEDRMKCLEDLWRVFNRHPRTWNLCISGSDENGNDMTNELSYDILKVTAKLRMPAPNLTMRVHKGTPDALWRSAAETLATGVGLPAIYNDDCVCKALIDYGIPKRDAHNYCMNGCNQIDIYGKSHMGLEDGEVSLAKCLEFTLFDGLCGLTGDKLSISTGDASEFKTFEEFFDAYKKQVEYITDQFTDMANKTQKIVSEYCPNAHRSLLIEGCIEKGLDVNNKGPLYSGAQILAEGIADTVDSLAVIKHFVYDTKKYSMSEITAALKADFVGYEEMQKEFSDFMKFGNAESYVDEIYKDVVEHFYKYLLTIPAWRGGTFSGGCSTFSRAAEYGAQTSALPNGRKKGSEIFAESIGAVPGCDKKGPTALLKSVLVLNQTLAKSGNVLQLKFPKKIFNSENGMKGFETLAKTYFANGGQMLQINVVSKEELIDAQKNPHLHRNLIVRVGGYSSNFTWLDKGLQNNVIARTEIEI